MELSRSIFAGLISGSLMGIFFLGVAVIVIISQPRAVVRLSNMSVRGMSTVKTSIFGALATVVAWTLIGAVLGLINHAVAVVLPGKGIGSPTADYTGGIVALSFVLSLGAKLYKRQYARSALVVGLGFAIIFG